jgi:chromosome segregation ATPase
MTNAKERLSSSKSNMAAETEAAGKAQNELQETKKTKAADEKYVASLSHDCNEAKEAWAERQASAKEEMAVIAKAQGILRDRVKVFVQTGKLAGKAHGDVEGAVETHGSRQDEATRQRLLGKLRQLSTNFKSYALMEMVSAAAADPFEKIRGLIEEMIAKLLNEANEEATQKSFCDEEMGKSKSAKDEKTMKLDTLQTRVDKATSAKAKLEESVKELEADIAALDKGDAEATAIRNQERETYQKSSKDFKDAAEAVTEAIQVLREYYEGALVQTATASAKAPQFGGAKSDAASVILSILEMSAEDFTKMYMQVEQEENTAKFEYEKLMQENKESRVAKAAEAKASQSEIKSLDVSIKNGGGDIDILGKELDAVMEYMEKLKPQCETKVMSYAERKSRREAEIEGLKEALSILEGEAAALVQTRQHLRG